MKISSARVRNPKIKSSGSKSRVRSILSASTGLRSVTNPWGGIGKDKKGIKFSKIAGRLGGGM
jgi:hypothetical protein